MRTFETGATRDSNTDKLDFSGFLSPRALRRFARYMHKHRRQADGTLRASSNWKKGIPIPSYVESMVRHVVDFWEAYEDGAMAEAEELACAIMFNTQGYLHETTKPSQAGQDSADKAA